MRLLRYSVAASLDGFIAGPNGEFDWIPSDPDIDFPAMYAGVSGLVMGRKSYDVFLETGGSGAAALPTYVCSRTLEPGTRNGVTFLADAVSAVRELKHSEDGKPLWLWGGGELFRSLAEARLVDEVEVAIIPVILGSGLPLIAENDSKLVLELIDQRTYEKTGILLLKYRVVQSRA